MAAAGAAALPALTKAPWVPCRIEVWSESAAEATEGAVEKSASAAANDAICFISKECDAPSQMQRKNATWEMRELNGWWSRQESNLRPSHCERGEKPRFPPNFKGAGLCCQLCCQLCNMILVIQVQSSDNPFCERYESISIFDP